MFPLYTAPMDSNNTTSISEPSFAPKLHTLDLLKLIALFLPILNLGVVLLQQSRSGLLNAVVSVLHIISNPIDSMWSILSRQEAVRRSYIFAAGQTPDVTREFSMVLATYDQWLEDARSHVMQALTARHQALHTTIHHVAPLLEEEKLLIRQCALSLRSCRIDGISNAILSIVTYLIALIILGFKLLNGTAASTQGKASHLLPFVSIWNYLVFAICINGSTGTFAHQEEAVRLIFNLHKGLNAISIQRSIKVLLPEPSFSSCIDNAAGPHTNASDFFQQYTKLGSVAGILNCLRPQKSYPHQRTGGRSSTTLCSVSSCAVAVSYLGAILVCFIMSAQNLEINIVLLSVYLLLWLINWILSIWMSALLNTRTISLSTYRRTIYGCDIFLVIAMLYCFIWFFLGLGDLDHTTGPVTMMKMVRWFFAMSLALTVMLVLNAWAEWEGSNARHIYTRSLEEALADAAAIA